MKNLIFGHKNPDTDSVCAALSLEYLKKYSGEDVEARVLGNIRKEAKFVLDYFNVNEPKLLKNVKIKAQDIKYDTIEPLTVDSSVFETYTIMEEKNIHTLPIVDSKEKLIGIVSMKDVGSALIHLNNNLVNTKIRCFLSVYKENNGEMLFNENEDDSVVGNLKLYNIYLKKDNEIKEDDVIIIQNHNKDHFFQNLDKHIEFLILSDFDNLEKEDIEKINKYNIRVMKIDLSPAMIIKKIHHTDSIESIMNRGKIECFYLNDYLNNVKDSMIKTDFRNYPLLASDGKYMGLISRKHLLNYEKKRVILVDHNEKAQTVDGIDEAEIIEIVDHHKIGGISTNMPISFTNKPLGSTCSIIYQMFKERNIKIPKEIAGLLISGLISDTLLFKSPTCTEVDKKIAYELKEILDLDLEQYARAMFKAGSSIEGMTIEEIVNNDFKEFTMKGKKVAISQIFTMDIEEIENMKDDILKYLQDLAQENNYEVVYVAVTDILKNGSYIYYVAYDDLVVEKTFRNGREQGTFNKDILSRKKQIVPKLTDALEEMLDI